MTGNKVYAFGNEGDFKRTENVVKYVERGGLEHPFHRMRVPIASGSDTLDGDSAGCCAGCVSRKYMTIFNHFANRYNAVNLPSTLGGSPVTLTFIGLTPSGGSAFPGITADDPYWESDTFTFTCAAGTDTYWWRMVVGASAPCRAGGGWDNVYLYLVAASSTLNCDFTAWNCGSLVAVPVIQYTNLEDFRGRCGSTLHIHWPQGQQYELEDILPCTVCVDPGASAVGYIAKSSADSSSCWDDFMTSYGITQIPDLLSAVVTVDGTDYNLLLEYSTSLKVYRIQTNPSYTGSPSSPGYTLGNAQIFLEVGCPTSGGGGYAGTGWYLTVEINCAVATVYSNTYATASGTFSVTKTKATPSCASVASVTVVISEL